MKVETIIYLDSIHRKLPISFSSYIDVVKGCYIMCRIRASKNKLWSKWNGYYLMCKELISKSYFSLYLYWTISQWHGKNIEYLSSCSLIVKIAVKVEAENRFLNYSLLHHVIEWGSDFIYSNVGIAHTQDSIKFCSNKRHPGLTHGFSESLSCNCYTTKRH